MSKAKVWFLLVVAISLMAVSFAEISAESAAKKEDFVIRKVLTIRRSSRVSTG